MSIEGAWIYTPTIWPDNRGTFHEVFKISLIESELGIPFPISQVNQSLSKKGVVRGIHWTDSPEGQAKYISCVSGGLWDVVVDLRTNSPTFGKWDAALITAENRNSVLISEGLGHAFLALEDDTIANYLCTSEFNPSGDRGLNPLSPWLEIPFASFGKNFGVESLEISQKDLSAPATLSH